MTRPIPAYLIPGNFITMSNGCPAKIKQVYPGSPPVAVVQDLMTMKEFTLYCV